MERVGTLIHKLQEQFEQQQDSHKLLITAQMLVAELQQQQEHANTGKVSVTMPYFSSYVQQPTVAIEPEATVEKMIEQVVEPLQSNVHETLINEPEQTVSEKTEPNNSTLNTDWLFNPSTVTAPTLAHHQTEEVVDFTIPTLKNEPATKEVYELKDIIAANDELAESLNEKLKEDKKEVAAVLQGTPVKDLKKAIGINDRYLFINELFRGDENMYERSLKTINSFNIYPEAEYWIQRELKVKLGWLEDNEAVKIFDQLVKRRFS